MRIIDWSSDVCSSDLEADRRIGAIGIGPEILPYARLRVEIGSDRAAVEDLDLGALDAFAEKPFAFALEREPIDIAAVPRLAVPAETVAALARLIFRAVEADAGDRRYSILLHIVMVGSDRKSKRRNTS